MLRLVVGENSVMRRSTIVRLVVIGTAGLGMTAYGLLHGPSGPAPQPPHCDDSHDDPSCNKSGSGSHGGGAIIAGGGARRDEAASEARAGSNAADAAPHGIARGGFGEAGAAHGGGGGE